MNTMNLRQNAFSTILGEDYQLLKHSYPHHDEFQQTVAMQVQQHYKSSNKVEITVLEAGAGSGVTSSFLLSADPRISIIAVDNSKAMLKQAAALLSGDIQRVSLIENDIAADIRERQSSSVDAFVAVWTLHNLPPEYRAELFQEIHRILKPGGLFVSGDKYTVDNLTQHQNLLAMQLERFKNFPTDNKSIIQAWVDHNRDDESIRISEEEQVTILTNLGFEDESVVYRQDMEAVVVGVKK